MSGNQKNKGPNRRTSTLYITGLDASVSDKDLRDECAKFGAIKRVTIIKDKETRVSKGFGYLLFQNEDEATKALKELDGRVIADKPVKCKYSFSETPEWQMILDSRRQQNGGGGQVGGKERGGAAGRGQGRVRGRGQGRGQSSVSRDGPSSRYSGEGNSYLVPSSQRGVQSSRGRGGPSGRGFSGGRGAARAPPPSYEREQSEAYRDPYDDPYGTPSARERPLISERDTDPYIRQRQPARYDDRPSTQYSDQQPAQYSDRQSMDYNERQPARYPDRESSRYEDRQTAIYGERRPPVSSEQQRSAYSAENSRAYGSVRESVRDDYDLYGTAPLRSAGGRDYSSRDYSPRDYPSRDYTPRESATRPLPAGESTAITLPPREASRDSYQYGRGTDTSRASVYETDRYSDQLPTSSAPLAERSAYGAAADRERQLPGEGLLRDPYDNPRKRSAQGYAGYGDAYDQPPARVPRAAPRDGYGY